MIFDAGVIFLYMTTVHSLDISCSGLLLIWILPKQTWLRQENLVQTNTTLDVFLTEKLGNEACHVQLPVNFMFAYACDACVSYSCTTNTGGGREEVLPVDRSWVPTTARCVQVLVHDLCKVAFMMMHDHPPSGPTAQMRTWPLKVHRFTCGRIIFRIELITDSEELAIMILIWKSFENHLDSIYGHPFVELCMAYLTILIHMLWPLRKFNTDWPRSSFWTDSRQTQTSQERKRWLDAQCNDRGCAAAQHMWMLLMSVGRRWHHWVNCL